MGRPEPTRVEVALPESVSVVVMAFNEVESLDVVVREIHEVLQRSERVFEVIIVDDGSSDGTADAADELARQLARVRAIHHEVNGGLGAVYSTGFSEAREDVITFLPADGQYPAPILEKLLPLTATTDLLLGYLEGRVGSPIGGLLSWAERLLYRLLLGPLPCFQGVFVLRRSVLDDINLVSTGRGWAIIMEMILKTRDAGFRTRSVLTDLRPRLAGRSKVRNLRTVLANLRQVVALAWQLTLTGRRSRRRRSANRSDSGA